MATNPAAGPATGIIEKIRTTPIGAQIYVLFMGSLILSVTQGLTFSGMTVFDSAILDELGMTVAELKFRDTLQFGVSAILAPAAGLLVDRIGTKIPFLIGCTLLAICFASYSLIDSAADIYAIHVVIGVGLKGAGMMVAVILISTWFGEWRGRVLGILVSGSSLGNALIPQLNTWLFGEFGWRSAFLIIALLPLALMPLIALIPKRSPYAAVKKMPDAPSDSDAPAAATVNYAQVLTSPRFWLLGIIGFTTFFSLIGASTNFVLHLQRDLGLPLERADDSLTLMFITAIVTKLAGGVVADWVGPKPVLISCLVLMLGGAITLSLMSPTLVWAGVVLFGLGWGALYTTIQLLPSRMFGIDSLGKIMGVLIVFETTAGALGPLGVGLGYTRTGSYQFSFTVIAVMLAVAVLCALLIKVDRVPAQTT